MSPNQLSLKTKWRSYSLARQLANIGSEVSRVSFWRQKNEPENLNRAVDRALELFDLTISDKRWRNRLKEILRLREIFCDFAFQQNNFQVSSKMLNDYFLDFAVCVAH